MQFPKPESQKPDRFRFSPRPNRASEINWLEWSEEAFNRSREEGKPILLAISAVWCHWCHVMDETSYSDEQNIKIINELYIPIRVDADKRPDIESRYLLGGWPTTAILTEEGEVMSGGTYIPPGQLRRLLQKAVDYYRENRENLKSQATQKRALITEAQLSESAPQIELSPLVVKRAMDSLHRSFDSAYGGFSSEPKFPNPPAIELLLRRAYLENETYLLEMAIITLDNMAKGEIFDDVWGGFFRYSTQRDWSVPHYEKLLSDNAHLIINYLHAYQVSERINYLSVAEKTLEYVDKFLAIKETGGFAGSQDADEEFYKLDAAGRAKAKIPYIDPVIYIDTNAMMASAYIAAYQVLGNRDYLSFALRTVDFLMKSCFSEEKGMAHYYDGAPAFLGLLSDQANMTGALIDAYGASGERSYLEQARKLVEVCDRTMRSKAGGFYDKAAKSTNTEADLGALFIRDVPIQHNAIMARNLYRLSYLADDESYESMARQALLNADPGSFEPIAPISFYALAADEVLTEPVVLTVIGGKEDAATAELLKDAWRRYIPGKEVKFFDSERDKEAIEKEGLLAKGKAVLYPCIGRMCLPPVDTPHELGVIVEELPGRLKQ